MQYKATVYIESGSSQLDMLSSSNPKSEQLKDACADTNKLNNTVLSADISPYNIAKQQIASLKTVENISPLQ